MEVVWINIIAHNYRRQTSIYLFKRIPMKRRQPQYSIDQVVLELPHHLVRPRNPQRIIFQPLRYPELKNCNSQIANTTPKTRGGSSLTMQCGMFASFRRSIICLFGYDYSHHLDIDRSHPLKPTSILAPLPITTMKELLLSSKKAKWFAVPTTCPRKL